MLRFLADWQEADGFLRDKIAQAKTDEPITSLAALQAAEAMVRALHLGAAPERSGSRAVSRNGKNSFLRRSTTSAAS